MKTLIIGAGAAGNKAALSVIGTGGITEKDIVLVNSTDRDIPKTFKGTIVVLSPENLGCGKERAVAKDLTLNAIQTGRLDISDLAEDYDIVVIVTSVEGGTGSGSTPILAKYCNQMLGKNTHVIAFLGFENDVRGLQNTVEFFQEIDEDIMVETIRNKAFLNASSTEMRAEQLANKELARRISIINGSELLESDHNIDATDIYKVTNTAGYMTVEYCEYKDSLVDVDDFNRLCKKMIYESKSLQTNDPGQNRMAVILNVSPSSEDAIDYGFNLLKETYGVPYECFMHKQFDSNKPEYVAYICSGMKMPLDEVKATYQRYLEESGKVNKAQDSFFDEIKDLHENEDDARFNMGRPTKRSTVGKDAFMSQFKGSASTPKQSSSKKAKEKKEE